jgi:hypothetical protein
MKFVILITLLISRVFALSEAEFITKILDNPDNFTKDKIYLQIKQLELDASYKNYVNWQKELSIEFENSYYDITKDTDSTYIYEKKRRNNSQKIALNFEKNFLNNPSTLSLDLSRELPSKDITRYKQDEFYNYYEIDTYDNNYKITWSYPFLKHNSNASSLKTYHNNILDLESEKLDFIDAKEDFLVDKLEDFLNLAALSENHKIYTNYLRELENIQLKIDKDKTKLITQVKLAQNLITTNQTKIKALKQDLKSSLSDNSLNLNNIALNYQKTAKLITNYNEFIVKNNRDLLRYDIDKKQKINDINYYDNQILPELDFDISAEYDQNRGNTLSTKYDNNAVEYVSSLVFTIPLGGDINDEKNLAVAKLNLEKLNLDYQSKLQNITAEIKSLDIALKLDKESIDDYPTLLNDIQAESNLQLENYQQKIITLKDVFDTLKQKRDTLLDYVDLVLNYQLNILEYNDILDNIIQ